MKITQRKKKVPSRLPKPTVDTPPIEKELPKPIIEEPLDESALRKLEIMKEHPQLKADDIYVDPLNKVTLFRTSAGGWCYKPSSINL